MVDGEPLLELLRQLEARQYHFIAITPETHGRVFARDVEAPPSLRDIFGWNRAFSPSDLDPELLSLLHAADALEPLDGRLRSKVRVASVGPTLFLHSSYPTEESDSVFFGPDTYRFVRFVEQQLTQMRSPSWIIDMGTGAGAGGIIAARLSEPSRTTLVDISIAALKLARINAAFAGAKVEATAGSTIPSGADMVIANPPYMMDRHKRTYRDGGDLLGGGIAFDWVQQALANMAPEGTMLLYTGAAYESGRAPLIDAIERACMQANAPLRIDEIDPDVFGEELDQPSYASVERIAAVGVVISKSAAQARHRPETGHDRRHG